VLQAPLSGRIVPADPLISGLHPPGGAGKLQASDHFASRARDVDQILQPRTVRHCITQIVVPAQKLTEQIALLPALNQLDIQGGKLLHAAGKPAMNLPRFGGRNKLSGGARCTWLFIRKRQNSLAFQPLQKITALPGFEFAAGALPFQQFAYRVGQFKSADSATGLYNLLNQRYLFCGNFSTAEPLLICRCLHAIVLSLLLRSRTMVACPAKNGHSRKKLSRPPPDNYCFQTSKKCRHITLAKWYLGAMQYVIDTIKCLTNRFQTVLRLPQKICTQII